MGRERGRKEEREREWRDGNGCRYKGKENNNEEENFFLKIWDGEEGRGRGKKT